MKVDVFINACLDRGYAWSRGVHEGEDGYFIGCERLDTAAHFTARAIEENEWPILERQITQGKDVYHVARVVGYYSRIENWNKSKLGELEGRHKGEYKVGSNK